jgi:hypothetical protein
LLHPVRLNLVALYPRLTDFIEAFPCLPLLNFIEEIHHQLDAMLRHHQGDIML